MMKVMGIVIGGAMEKCKVLVKVSVLYWAQHKRRLLTLAVTIVMGVMALCSCALLVRSEKSEILKKELTILGDYDAIFYET